MKRYIRAVLTPAVVAGAVLSAPSPADAFTDDDLAFALTSADEIQLIVGSGTGTVIETTAVTGLDSGDDLVAIDIRPATYEIYALGDLGNIYTVSPDDGVATKVNSTPISLTGATSFGFDFNPTVDRIRITTDNGLNYRIVPDTGAVAATDGTLAYAAGDTNSGSPNVVASAYTKNFDGTATTTLYNVDSTTDDLVIQNPPNAGTLQTVGPLGFDLQSTAGFDITGGKADRASLVSTTGSTSTLYDVDLVTGAATSVGTFSAQIDDIALTPEIPAGDGYALAAADGGVFNYGSSAFQGSAGGLRLNSPIVDVANTSGSGYWLAAADGGVFSYGDAEFYGSAGATRLNRPIVGMSPTLSDGGYWLVASDGGVFSYGDAEFYGSAGATRLNSPIVGMTVTPTGEGYWLVAADGGVFSYGDAEFYGSAGATRLNSPIVGIAPTTTGSGYWLFAADGGVFSYGDATFRGSAGSTRLNSPIVDGAAALDGSGYWLVAADGGVFSYGSQFYGSAGSTRLNSPVTGIAGR